MKNKKSLFAIVTLIIMGLVLPLCSAYDSQYNFDLDSRINIVIAVCMLIGASILFFTNYKPLSSFIFVIIGILFLFNGLNVILSAVIIILGVMIIFIK